MTFLQQVQFQSDVVVTLRWPDLKSILQSKNLLLQYVSLSDSYVVFALDDKIIYTSSLIFTSVSLTYVFDPDYSQSQNDTDIADFEGNFKPTANGLITSSSTQISVLSNETIIVGGNKTFSGLNNRQVSLFINVPNPPTGVSPGLQFTLQEIDPGDLTTAIGTTVTGLAITAAGTQEIILNLTTSSAIKVSWIIVGTSSPTFTGVYATITSKPTTVFSGIDVNGTEQVLQPDTNGRLMVVGSTAVGGAGVGNPVLIGGIVPNGTAAYSTLSSDSSTIVSQGVNKQPIFINGTITANGISNIIGLGVPMVNLFINIKNMPTGTNPSIIFSMYEIDPGDQSTPLGTSVSGIALTTIGTQILTLPLTTSGIVQVSWTVNGVSPSFSGVYVTASMKDANMITGPAVDGSPMMGNPIITGAVDQIGNAQSLSAKLINGYTNLMVHDETIYNKLDQIILLLRDIIGKENSNGD